MKQLIFSLMAASLAACTTPDITEVSAPAPEPVATVQAPVPVAGARTAETLDTTTPEQRAQAVAVANEAGSKLLGTTIATLGNPAQPGFWLETPLVREKTMGRVDYPANGKSVAVELIPTGGDVGSGSRMSLAAMRLLEAPLTGLPEVQVYR